MNMPSVEVVTKDGIEINFNGIGVLSTTKKEKLIKMIRKYGMGFKDVLIYDRIRENLRIFCAGKTIDEVYNEHFLEISIQKQIIETEGQKNISEINNQIVRDKQNNLADIAKYAKDKEAAGNQALFSPQYVKLQVAQSLVNNTKFFFSGQDSVLGGLLTKILAS